MLPHCFCLVISEKGRGCTRVGVWVGSVSWAGGVAVWRRSLELVCSCCCFYCRAAVVLSLCSQTTCRQNRRYCWQGTAAKGSHTHTQSNMHMGCAALMSYAQRYARTKLVLYILCAVKRLLSAFCRAAEELLWSSWSRWRRDGFPQKCTWNIHMFFTKRVTRHFGNAARVGSVSRSLSRSLTQCAPNWCTQMLLESEHFQAQSAHFMHACCNCDSSKLRGSILQRFALGMTSSEIK